MKTIKDPKQQGSRQVDFAVGGNFRADAAAGRLLDVALITKDREATGHGLWIDQRTLDTALESAARLGGKLRAYISHLSWADFFEGNTDRVLQMPGYFEGLKIAGEKLIAESFTFFDSFKRSQAEAYERLMEMTEKTPELFGLSIESYGYAVFVDADGNEYSAEPDGDDVELLYDGMPAFRVTDLRAAAFVDQPAANDGLFSRIGRAVGFGPRGPGEDTIRLLAEAFMAFQKAQAGNGGLTRRDKGKDDAISELTTKEKSAMDKLIEALRAKYEDDEKRLSRALLFATRTYAENPELSADDVEARLKAEDEEAELKALREKAASADTISAELDRLKQERDAFEKKFKEIKKSGFADGDVPTGKTDGQPAGIASQFTGATREVIEFQAARGRYDLAVTDIGDIFVPDIWIRHKQELKPEGYTLLNTGVVVSNEDIREKAQGGGHTVNMPLLHEPDPADEVQDDNAPTINNLTSSTGVAPFFNRRNSLGWNAFAKTQSGLGGDIVTAANQYMTNIRWRNRQNVLFEILAALFGTTGAGAYAALRNDNFIEAGDSATADELWSSDMFHDAVAKLGERADDLQNGALVVHTDIRAAMNKQDDVTVIRDSDGRFMVRTYKQELPIIASSSPKLKRAGTTNGSVYTSYVFAPSSIAMDDREQTAQVGDMASLLVEEDKKLNTQVIYDRQRYILHPNGAHFVGVIAAAKSGPTDAEINAEADWETVLDNVVNAGMIQIKTNG